MLAMMTVSCSPDKPVFQHADPSLQHHLCAMTCRTLLAAQVLTSKRVTKMPKTERTTREIEVAV